MIKLLSKKSVLYIIIYLSFIHTIVPQEENTKWVLGIGVNIINYFPTYAPNTGNNEGLLNEFFNIEDHWNFSGPQLIVSRHLMKRFFVDGLISRNNILFVKTGRV